MNKHFYILIALFLGLTQADVFAAQQGQAPDKRGQKRASSTVSSTSDNDDDNDNDGEQPAKKQKLEWPTTTATSSSSSASSSSSSSVQPQPTQNAQLAERAARLRLQKQQEAEQKQRADAEREAQRLKIKQQVAEQLNQVRNELNSLCNNDSSDIDLVLRQLAVAYYNINKALMQIAELTRQPASQQISLPLLLEANNAHDLLPEDAETTIQQLQQIMQAFSAKLEKQGHNLLQLTRNAPQIISQINQQLRTLFGMASVDEVQVIPDTENDETLAAATQELEYQEPVIHLPGLPQQVNANDDDDDNNENEAPTPAQQQGGLLLQVNAATGTVSISNTPEPDLCKRICVTARRRLEDLWSRLAGQSLISSSSSAQQKNPFNQLPTDVSGVIFNFLGSKDLANACRVNRHFNTTIAGMWECGEKHECIRRLCINEHQFKAAQLSAMASSFRDSGKDQRSFNEITLYNCAFAENELTQILATWAKELTHLELSSGNITDAGLQTIANCCHNLTHLDLSDCRQITDTGLQTIANGCHNLTNLDLSGCYQITDTGLQTIANGCHNLTHLELSSGNITDAGLQTIANGCHNLTHLDLSDCDQITDTGLQTIANGCHHLTNLNLGGCCQITDTGLQFIANGCPNLTNLNLGSCRKITNTGLQTIANGCPNLTSLNLRGCDQITDTDLQTIANGCPNLTNLNLAWCQKITDTGLQALANNCPNLTHLNLSDCSRITDAGLKHIAQNCPMLTHLELRGCQLITDATIQSIQKQFPKINIVRQQ